MKLKNFHDKSIIMGCFLANQAIQNSLDEDLSKLKINFLSALILAAIYFENSQERLGPSRLANTLGFSRSRVSQEITILQKKALITRVMSESSARDTYLKLTASGERKAHDIVKIFSRLQLKIDKAIGEKNAEEINESMLELRDYLL